MNYGGKIPCSIEKWWHRSRGDRVIVPTDGNEGLLEKEAFDKKNI